MIKRTSSNHCTWFDSIELFASKLFSRVCCTYFSVHFTSNFSSQNIKPTFASCARWIKMLTYHDIVLQKIHGNKFAFMIRAYQQQKINSSDQQKLIKTLPTVNFSPINFLIWWNNFCFNMQFLPIRFAYDFKIVWSNCCCCCYCSCLYHIILQFTIDWKSSLAEPLLHYFDVTLGSFVSLHHKVFRKFTNN